jgi:glycosyltransferase involved in cell wall biosynthesis
MISIIIPFFNERENLPILYKELVTELEPMNRAYELVFVNDGSTDESGVYASKLAETDNHVVFVNNRKRSGKGNALANGIRNAKGDIYIFMDADLQNDPKDIPHFLEKIDAGYDLINGVRDGRDDNSLIRMYSRLGNKFVKRFLKSPFTDINSGYKAIRKEVLQEFTLYSNNFRFMPLAAYMKGFKVGEVKIHNRPRSHGVSKFGTSKIFIGLIDTLTAYFLYQFSERPLHFFGIIGGVFFAIGFFYTVFLTIERLFYGMLLYRRPALLYSILFIIVGIQIIMTGFIGELIVYFHKRLKS